jgi:hypothetical protein
VKHEANPSASNMSSEYRETIDLSSASAWTKYELESFHVKFAQNEYTDLETEIGPQFYGLEEDHVERSAVSTCSVTYCRYSRASECIMGSLTGRIVQLV